MADLWIVSSYTFVGHGTQEKAETEAERLRKKFPKRAFKVYRIKTTLQKSNTALELEALQKTFDVQWEADMRVIALWQAAHTTDEMVWPDRADMVLWLMNERDRMKGMLLALAQTPGIKKCVDTLFSTKSENVGGA